MTTLLAMHGWAGDSRGWQPLAAAAAARGWSCLAAERGYGGLPRRQPAWLGGGPRLLVVHSLGLHLLPQPVLAAAEAVVLLASFGRFVPEGPAGRRLRTALAGMRTALEGSPAQASTMLSNFLAEATAPLPLEALPATLLDRPLQPEGQAQLLADLQRLEASTGLPPGFPQQVPCLIVQAGADRIVAAEASQALSDALPQADQLLLHGAGHTLLASPVLPMLLAWIEGQGFDGNGDSAGGRDGGDGSRRADPP